MPPTLKAE